MSQPAPAATTDTTAPHEWRRFLAALRRARARASQDPAASLSLPQYMLVAPLLDAPDAAVGELAAQAGVASPTATRMLDGLEREKLVARSPAPHDRRSVVVRLTRQGRRVAGAQRDHFAAKGEALFAALDPEEREPAARLLGRLADVMEEL
jgi:DNA-binding MarR family transcriptional regulator